MSFQLNYSVYVILKGGRWLLIRCDQLALFAYLFNEVIADINTKRRGEYAANYIARKYTFGASVECAKINKGNCADRCPDPV